MRAKALSQQSLSINLLNCFGKPRLTRTSCRPGNRFSSSHSLIRCPNVLAQIQNKTLLSLRLPLSFCSQYETQTNPVGENSSRHRSSKQTTAFLPSACKAHFFWQLPGFSFQALFELVIVAHIEDGLRMKLLPSFDLFIFLL